MYEVARETIYLVDFWQPVSCLEPYLAYYYRGYLMAAVKKYTKEEDDIIRKYCQVKTAEEIGMMLGRPKNGIHHRINRLGLSGRLYGEHHWNARHSDLVRLAIGIMSDGGMTSGEIHRVLTTPEDIKLSRVVDIAGGRA